MQSAPVTVVEDNVVTTMTPTASVNPAASAAIADFRSTCLTATPDTNALVAPASAAGFQVMLQQGNTVLGTAPDLSSSFQLNVATSYAYECVVTFLDSGNGAGAVQQALLAAAGGSTRVIGGTTYTVSMETNSSGGLTERALILRAN